MRDFTCVLVYQNVVTVTIAEANDVPNHAPDCIRLHEVNARLVPQVRS
jgi:hypothetical protein